MIILKIILISVVLIIAAMIMLWPVYFIRDGIRYYMLYRKGKVWFTEEECIELGIDDYLLDQMYGPKKPIIPEVVDGVAEFHREAEEFDRICTYYRRRR